MFVSETNPNKILKLKSEHVNLGIHRNTIMEPDAFSFLGFYEDNIVKDYPEFFKTIGNAKIVLEISTNVDQQRFELGTIQTPKYCKKELISLQGNMFSLKFNFFIAQGPRKLASCENIKPFDEDRQNRRGLVKVEPCDLGEFAWRVYPLDGSTEPILQVNNNARVNIVDELLGPRGKVMIFLNAVEQILWLLPNADPSSDWVADWKDFLAENDIDYPDELDQDKEKRLSWHETTIEKLSNDWALFSNLVSNLEGEDNGN